MYLEEILVYIFVASTIRRGGDGTVKEQFLYVIEVKLV